MADMFGYVLQGLFTGIGGGISLWLLERHLKKRLDSLEAGVKASFDMAKKWDDSLKVKKKDGGSVNGHVVSKDTTE